MTMKGIGGSSKKKLVFISAIFIFCTCCSGWAGEGITITDATGEQLVFEHPPARIVSLNPDFTENLFALGAGERVVGVTNFCRYPDEFGSRARVGNLWQPNLEAIISLTPDLVLATKEGNRPETVKALRRLGVPVFVTGEIITFRDYFELLHQLGCILGQSQTADLLVNEFRNQIEHLQVMARKSPRVTVFFQVGVKPIVTINKNTLVHEIINIAGGVNLAAESPLRYPTLSQEQVLVENPEVIIIAAMGSEAKSGREKWERFTELEAVKNNRLFVVDPDLVCHLSPRLREGLRKIALFLHPEWLLEKQK